ncbi:phytohormone-binding protein-like [Papaver somniferum]|uniref:phytohormone-binding protein-like n=1 Tax=Papaver somniferum TaxID=3469 RepID=UPI000E6FBD3F|nr:phytohormone-binding protein-like [Papaver somniferum]
MRKETTAQTWVEVDIGILWEALAKDLWLILPKVIPNLVKYSCWKGTVDLGLILVYCKTEVTNAAFQKEKIVELDENEYRFGLEVIQGGHLNHGFTYYATTFKLSTEIGVKKQTLVDITITYDTEREEIDMPLQTAKSASTFMKALETYLLTVSI